MLHCSCVQDPCLATEVSQTFSALEQLSKGGSQRHCVLNPVVGPEPVTGSSRMKGGSATKVFQTVTYMRVWSSPRRSCST